MKKPTNTKSKILEAEAKCKLLSKLHDDLLFKYLRLMERVGELEKQQKDIRMIEDGTMRYLFKFNQRIGEIEFKLGIPINPYNSPEGPP